MSSKKEMFNSKPALIQIFYQYLSEKLSYLFKQNFQKPSLNWIIQKNISFF